MPNTLVHLCLQTPASRLLVRGADFKWIALGCIIPDIPWIVQRIIISVHPGIDLLDLRIYAVIQASLFFCLLFSLALSLITAAPGRIFFLLSFNSLAHLLLDALQTKWANGVHFFAPVSWKITNFSTLWPEHVLIYGLTFLGLGVLIASGAGDWKKTVRFTTGRINRYAALLLALSYFLLPFLFFHGPEQENSHYVATLRDKGSRTGKPVEFDRRIFRGSDNTLHVFSGEQLQLQGNIPEGDALLSIRGRFVDEQKVEVTEFHNHSIFRDLASLTGLAGIIFIWLLAILGKQGTITHKYRQ